MINTDFTLYIYGTEAVICYLTTALFLWWAAYKWVKVKHCPSVIYILVMMWFLAQGYATHLAYYSRELGDTSGKHEFLQSMWWHTRAIPRLAIAILICWRQSLKVYIEFFRKEKRRRGDKDGEDV